MIIKLGRTLYTGCVLCIVGAESVRCIVTYAIAASIGQNGSIDSDDVCHCEECSHPRSNLRCEGCTRDHVLMAAAI